MRPPASVVESPPTFALQGLRPAFGLIGALAFIYASLWLYGPQFDLGLSGYLPLHTALEVGAIVVAALAFGVSWNAYAATRPGNIVIIGVVLLGAGLLDFAHAISYRGMPDFVTPASPQKAIEFWLAARYLVAVGLLVVACRGWQPLREERSRYSVLWAVLAYVGLCYAVVLFHPERLPVFYVEGRGLTPLKIALEYGLVALHLVAAFLFLRAARRRVSPSAAGLFAASAVAALSELCFTLYGSVSDIFNFVGHLYKIVFFGLIYKVVFVDSVRQPFEALSRALAREQAWAGEQHAFVQTLDMLDEAVLELTPTGQVVSANAGWWRLVGAQATAGYDLVKHLHEGERDAFLRRLVELVGGAKTEFRGRFRFLGEGRHEQWLECRFVAEHAPSGGAGVRVRGVLRDITKSYLQERHISHMALHDALTNLPNRILLEDRIGKAVQLAGRHAGQVAVCFIDLDHFKDVNDAYGHKTGDQVLVAVAKALAACLREGDTLARWGGDEFVVLLPELTEQDAPRRVAQKLAEALRQPFDVEGMAMTVTFSMGIAVFPDDGADTDSLLAQADRAMFYAKSQGRNNFQMYAEMSRKGLGKKELYIQTHLTQAVRENRIAVWFQPQVQAAVDGGAPRLVGVEALARWEDAEYGAISPASFIPMAESLGLISDLGISVRRQALQAFRRWRVHHPELELSINISKRQLFGGDFVDSLLADVSEAGVPPSSIVLEVTESVALMDVEFAEERLRQLADADFTLSIDDFGTGYASLSQLHELPVGELKIDLSFVRRVHTPEGLRMVQAIVNLAQALGLRTVAEGVEDAECARRLVDLGVDRLQGYLFGKPSPAEVLEVSPLFRMAPATGANTLV